MPETLSPALVALVEDLTAAGAVVTRGDIYVAFVMPNGTEASVYLTDTGAFDETVIRNRPLSRGPVWVRTIKSTRNILLEGIK